MPILPPEGRPCWSLLLRAEVGLEAFRLLVNAVRFRLRPMVLETPKEDGDNADMDDVNLAVLRGLVERAKGETA